MRARWLAVVSLLSLGACHQGDDEAAQRERLLDTPAARRLTGMWTVAFEADAGTTLTLRRGPGLVAGTLVLGPDHHGPTSTAELSGITHQGAYDVDFRPFGWSTRSGDEPAAAVARVITAGGSGADSLYMVLSPGTQRFAVRMTGTVAGDSATGRWIAISYGAGGGSGRFVMRRQASVP